MDHDERNRRNGDVIEKRDEELRQAWPQQETTKTTAPDQREKGILTVGP